jgi:two-component system OmpR family sensor kinase
VIRVVDAISFPAPSGPGRIRSSAATVAAGSGALLLIAGVVLTGSEPPVDPELAPYRGFRLTIAVAGSAIGGAAAGVGALAARLSGHAEVGWIAGALAVYSLVEVAAAATWLGPEPGTAVGPAAIAAGLLVAAALLVIASSAAGRLRSTTSRALAGGGSLLAVVVVGLAAARPTILPASTATTWFTALALSGWCAVAAGIALRGIRGGSLALFQLGLGLAVVGLVSVPFPPGTAGSSGLAPALALIRLCALGLVLLGLIGFVRLLIRRWDAERLEHEEEQRVAVLDLQRAARAAADRDHELRNGVNGLTGIAQLVGRPGGSAEHDRLRGAVLHELARLAALVERREAPEAPARDVAAVLSDLVALRRIAGMAIDLDVAGDLRAVPNHAVVAQVVTNVLANCDRHAPGARVHLRARRCGDRIVIAVSDDGPGIASGLEELVLRGAEGGRGLRIVRQLLSPGGGTLRLVPNGPGRRGCTAIVELRAARSDGGRTVEVAVPAQRRPEGRSECGSESEPASSVSSGA